MIRPEPSAPTRQDLAQQVSFLPWKLFKGAFGGKTAQEVRELAQNMASEGATAKEIHDATASFANQHETGMFQNPAQQWGFELSDKDARLTPQALEMLKEPLTGDFGNSTGEMSLNRLLQHDTLYDYAPGMKDVRADLTQPHYTERNAEPGGKYNSPATAGGQGTPHGRFEAYGSHDIPPDYNDPQSLLGMVGHEKEHALQSMFGLPQGGNPDDLHMQKFFKENMQPQADQIRIMAEQERERFAKEFAGGNPDMLQGGRDFWRESKPDQALALGQAQYVGGAPGRTTSTGLVVPRKNPIGNYDQYRSLAGEQSADQAAYRMGMDTEERRANPMFMSSDTSRLSPALQTLKWGPGQFALPDLRWGLANTMLGAR